MVVHLSAQGESRLASILSRAGSLPARQASNGERIEPGRIYVPPPDRHLLLEDGRTVVVRGPKENRSRPAVDPLFRSAAIGCGPRTIGVLLSGNLDDGTAGLWQIKRCGGLAVVQDPKEARFPGMVESALGNVQVDHVVALKDMAALLERLVESPAVWPGRDSALQGMSIEHRIAKMEDNARDIYEIGKPSAYVCPECGGTLFRIQEGKPKRYRCRTGHAYSEATLIAEETSATEDKLWAGMRALREYADLLKRQAKEHDREAAHSKRLLEVAAQAEDQANQIREIIAKNGRALEDLSACAKNGAEQASE